MIISTVIILQERQLGRLLLRLSRVRLLVKLIKLVVEYIWIEDVLFLLKLSVCLKFIEIFTDIIVVLVLFVSEISAPPILVVKIVFFSLVFTEIHLFARQLLLCLEYLALPLLLLLVKIGVQLEVEIEVHIFIGLAQF